jgi:hypothetical protein
LTDADASRRLARRKHTVHCSKERVGRALKRHRQREQHMSNGKDKPKDKPTATDIVEKGSPADQKALIGLAKTRYATENIAFMFAVLHYRKLTNKHRMPLGNVPIEVVQIKGFIPFEYRAGANTMGKWIYDTFVDPNAPLWVNLKAKALQDLQKIAQTRSSPFTPPDFDTAYAEISYLASINLILP